MKVPLLPMSPILKEHLPAGEDWCYQLKWDGMRIIAVIDTGKVTLYSKTMRIQNGAFPDLITYLQQEVKSDCILDGEVVVLDPHKQRPNFHLLLKRLRAKNMALIHQKAQTLPVTYVLFDLLSLNGTDLRGEPLKNRYERLREQFAIPSETCIVTDSFSDGSALWQWVRENEWEGVVSKRLNSLYHEGKKHNDWYKTKVVRAYDVRFVGYMKKDGRLASLLMTMDGMYCGKVSAGLNQRLREDLQNLSAVKEKNVIPIPQTLKINDLYWFLEPLYGVVTSMEMTEDGILRQPKIIKIMGGK